MQGGYDEEEPINQDNIQIKLKNNLVPITIKMFNDSVISHNDRLEYKNITLTNVTLNTLKFRYTL